VRASRDDCHVQLRDFPTAPPLDLVSESTSTIRGGSDVRLHGLRVFQLACWASRLGAPRASRPERTGPSCPATSPDPLGMSVRQRHATGKGNLS
jgi:hypothetical protein